MNRCQATCPGTEQRAYRFAMRHDVFTACADCAAYLEGQGLTLIPVERRIGAVPVATDRRRVVARWIRNIRPVDRTGLLR